MHTYCLIIDFCDDIKIVNFLFVICENIMLEKKWFFFVMRFVKKCLLKKKNEMILPIIHEKEKKNV
jgi:hypothetical protein